MKPAPSWHLWTKKHGSYVKLTAQINKKLLRRKLVAGSFSWKKMRTENHHQVLGDSKKVTTHPDIAHPFGNPRFSTMKGFPENSLLVKVFSGCVPVRCVETTLEGSVFAKQQSKYYSHCWCPSETSHPFPQKKGAEENSDSQMEWGREKYVFSEKSLHSVKLKTSLPLKIDSWKTDPFLLRKVIF